MRPTPAGSPIPGNLRRLRLAAGLTQAELAELADVTDATLSRIERGRFAPSQDLLRRLAVGVRTTEAELLARKPETRKSSLRAVDARLLALVRDWEEAAVDDLIRGLRLIVSAAVRSGRPPRTPSERSRREHR
jgi:transcriptional regulator with XRE-family HTH domain